VDLQADDGLERHGSARPGAAHLTPVVPPRGPHPRRRPRRP
jgi:hypothetical protein